MGKCATGIRWFLATLLVMLAAGCGEETVTIADTTRPLVTSTIPANGATGVPLAQVVSATFSKPMNAATITGTTFTLTGPGATPVAGTVAYTSTGSIASFTPSASLLSGTLYTATITTGAQDTASPANALAANYVWTFTTVVIPPAVISTIPVAGAKGVPLNQAISATFSKAMNPATLNSTTFTVTTGGVAVAGTVSYTGLVATFTPTAALPPGTVLTATITTGAQDVAGDPLAANYVWTFTTVAVPPTVISTIPANGATAVPLNQVISATFSKALNPSTVTAATFTVTAGGTTVAGTVTYSGLVATFTPTAALPSGTVLTATITTGAQDVAGDPLAANYVWTFTTVAVPPTVISTIPANGATAVPLNQVISATFSKALNPSTVTAATFTVTAGGAAVAGTVTYSGLVATFTPAAALPSGTVLTATITTGAQDVAGDPLAANYVWTFTTVAVAPAVISTVSANGATGVPVNQGLSATFSKPLNPATINPTTFTVSVAGTPIAGTITYSGTTATFTPTTALPSGTVVTATITTGAQDTSGDPLAANYVWTFTTAVVPPTVLSTIPANGATAVPLNQVISATFSKALNPTTVNSTTFTVTAGGTAIAGTVSYAGTTATFTPSAALPSGTVLTATLTTGIQDVAGDPLAANYVWTFTTVAVPPTVISTIPANGATSVPLNQVISATFSKALNPTTVNSTTFTVAAGGTAIAGTVSYAGTTATFTPTAALPSGTVLTATLTTGVQDVAGDPLAANYVWNFTTVAVPPTVLSTIPANGATSVPLNQVISATFSKALNPTTVYSTTFTVAAGGTAIAGTVSYAGTTATFTPSAALPSGTVLTATITTGVQDVAGDPLAANYVWNFTTVVVPPTVVSTTPINGATGVPLNQVISATFSKAMNPATINSTTFIVSVAGTPVAGAVTYTGTTASFTPAANLATGTLFTVTITTGAQDVAGDPLAANYVSMFRTVPAPTPPMVIATNPANNATGVPVNQAITATFSEAINPATVNSTTFTVSAGGVNLPGTVTYLAAGSIATFTPNIALTPSTLITATITTGVQDLSATPLATNYVWTFTTGLAPDTTPPTVVLTNPLNGATNVPLNQAVSATFSEAVTPSTVNASSFTLTSGGVAVPGLVTYAVVGQTATFTPTSTLAPSTLFTATITTAVTDLAGNALAMNYVWTFTTGVAPDTTPPTIISTNPADGATGVALNQAINVTFSEAMDPLTISTTTFKVMPSAGAALPGTVSYNPLTLIATFTPTAPLLSGTLYTANITTGATDLAGNNLAPGLVPNPWTFATGITILPPPINLGTASVFGGYGGAGMTNMGTSTLINGTIGTTGVSTTITGFHDNGPGCVYTETLLNIGLVNGAIDTAPPPPTVFCPAEGTAITSAIAAQAAADALTAYNQLVAIPGGLDVSVCPGCGGGSAIELGNRTLVGGVYKAAAVSFGITQGDLTLDAQGNPNAYWIFQMGSTLTVGTPASHRSVILVNGALAKNVFWQVGTSATINGILGGGTMVGTIIAQAGVAVSTAGVAAVTTINGRAISLNASVTLVNTVINVPAP